MPKAHQKTPCAECPWRRDVPTGRFEAERYRALAKTAYDVSLTQFACHKSPKRGEFACAGFLLRGADHNLAVRFSVAKGDYGDVSDGGYPLYENYREMAEANGVDPEDEVLTPCR